MTSIRGRTASAAASNGNSWRSTSLSTLPFLKGLGKDIDNEEVARMVLGIPDPSKEHDNPERHKEND